MRGTRAERHRENRHFLKALRRTANVTLAAEAAGQTRKTFQKRRARDPDFAAQWDAALSFAQAQLAAGTGATTPAGDDAAITAGGEYSVRASRGRRLQVRRAPKGLLTTEGERRFLAHLAATANVRLSAAATGIGWNAIYAGVPARPTSPGRWRRRCARAMNGWSWRCSTTRSGRSAPMARRWTTGRRCSTRPSRSPA